MVLYIFTCFMMLVSVFIGTWYGIDIATKTIFIHAIASRGQAIKVSYNYLLSVFAVCVTYIVAFFTFIYQ